MEWIRALSRQRYTSFSCSQYLAMPQLYSAMIENVTRPDASTAGVLACISLYPFLKTQSDQSSFLILTEATSLEGRGEFTVIFPSRPERESGIRFPSPRRLN